MSDTPPDSPQRADQEPFEAAQPDYQAAIEDSLVLNLDGFEGPIDVLLTLARTHKVDITKISILGLAEQYLAFIQRAHALRLEIAADYLVMAAWLAYLKSRLLLPSTDDEDEPTGAELAARLAFQLQRLEAMRKAAGEVMERPQLGQDFYARGEPDPLIVDTTTEFSATLYDLLTMYAGIRERQGASTLQISPARLYSMDDALERLGKLLGHAPDWTTLSQFLPEGIGDDLMMRSAIASTFAASLELARQGKLQLNQSQTFAPIYVRARQEDTADG
ncbi:MAG: ScpA family protein [Rhodospirillaceae bacterium]|nr:ScpA family protein [Rhodospirillaceae bacterium]MDD9918867.1 ScpA family protein [Rhodospirillaceae bacterium]MDD9929993.1 ScpA family protein [Rhodospirillaceae bacterium]